MGGVRPPTPGDAELLSKTLRPPPPPHTNPGGRAAQPCPPAAHLVGLRRGYRQHEHRRAAPALGHGRGVHLVARLPRSRRGSRCGGPAARSASAADSPRTARRRCRGGRRTRRRSRCRNLARQARCAPENATPPPAPAAESRELVLRGYCRGWKLEADFRTQTVAALGLDGDAMEGNRTEERPQKRLGRRLEEVAKAVGGGYCLCHRGRA